MYLDQSLAIISTLDYFSIAHISRQDIWDANELTQQASGYHVNRGIFHISHKPMFSVVNTCKTELKPIDSVTNEGS